MTLSRLLKARLDDRYRIERELGAGGMATVYLAEDVKHHRKVAIKVLHAELSAVLGPERFLKEIELTANLQHPHILPLFDSGSADGLLYYVMPYVDGETLRGRLERETQLPIVDAVRIATEVADALSCAHERGVIHRDIKPENILLQNGHALVADFGIALAVEQAGGARMTQTGLSLGTPQYMAPEQAMGERTIDARTDVYALGAITYEMLAGEPPFTGPSAQAIVAKVMTEEPRSLRSLRRSAPEHVEFAVLGALEKLPADRFSTAREFAAALDAHAPAPYLARGRSARPARARSAAMFIIGVLGAATIAILGFAVGRQVANSDAPPMEFGRASRTTWDAGLEVQPAISPDGRSVAYAAGSSTDTRIYVREVAGGRAHRLTDDSASGESDPSWSPDGARVLFLARGTVYSAPAGGGPPRQELPAEPGSIVSSAAWAPDGRTIAYTVGDSLFTRTAAGERRLVAQLLQPSRCRWSPDGKLLACSSGNADYLRIGSRFGNLSPNRIVVCRVNDGRITDVTSNASINVSPIWSSDGRWLYFVSNRDGRNDLYAQRMTSDGQTDGAASRLSVGLGAQSISLSADGSRVTYAVYTTRANLWSQPLPSNGIVIASGAMPVTTGDQVIENVTVSPDGRWLLFDSNVTGNSDLYRLPLHDGLATGREPERLTTDPADDFAPSLSPDGTEIAFHSWREGSRDIWVRPLDGRSLERVTSDSGQELVGDWSPDGQALSFVAGADRDDGNVFVVRRDTAGRWGTPVRRSKGIWAIWSPDGRSLAVVDRVRGGSLFIVPSDSGAAHKVLDAELPGAFGVGRPQWSEDGSHIIFKSHDARGLASIWSVPASGGMPRMLIRFDDPAHQSYRDALGYRRGRAYFPIADRQSDVWVMEVRPR